MRQNCILRLKSGLRRKKRLTHGLVLVVSGGLLALALTIIQPFYTFNLWFSDQFLSSETPSSNIVIVGIDDESLKTYGKWSSWPRTLHAKAVNNLARAGATAIGFDVVFPDDSPEDASFAAAIGQANNVVLAVAGTDKISQTTGVNTYGEVLTPAGLLSQNCSNTGHVNIVPDPDGKVRRLPLVVRSATGETFPALSVAVLHTLFHKSLPSKFTAIDEKLTLVSREVPVDPSYSLRLNFAVNEGKISHISYSDVIRNTFDQSLIKNKIVLIGMTATGDLDTWAIPNSAARVPGVLIHAAAIDTILRTSFLTEAGIPFTVLLLALLILICALVLPLFGTSRSRDIFKATGFVIALMIIYLVLSSISASRGYILNVLYPSLLLGGLFVSDILYIVIREQADDRFVRELFGRYVSPQISKQILNMANEGELRLGGEEREVTILFADIRNFTTISEHMSPDAVVQMLNTCLPVLIEAIVRNGGLVNKFAGDNLMGVWNAPQSEPRHALLAVKAAMEGQSEMAKFVNTKTELAQVQFGIGINTGRVLAGNVGSIGRTEYTVIGDAVNLASRICGFAPGGQVIIGADTYHEIAEYVDVEALEPQVFKGKSQPVPIFRIIRLNNST